MVLSASSGGVSIALFATVIDTLVGIPSANLSLVFSISNSIARKLLKTMRKKKWKYNKIVLVARSQLNRIENIISNALTVIEISHVDFNTIFNEEKNIVN